MNKPLGQLIGESGKKVVMAIAGGGYSATGRLTIEGGTSGVLLETVHLSHQKAFDTFIGGKPDKYVSLEAARALAMAAYKRAVTYSDDRLNCIGIGFTSSLAKGEWETERPERRHQVYFAIQTHHSTTCNSFDLSDGTKRNEQEFFLSDFIQSEFLDQLCLYDWTEGYDDSFIENGVSNYQYQTVKQNIIDVVHGKIDYAFDRIIGTIKVVFPTSCNPLHDTHVNIIEYASKHLDCPVHVELCVGSPFGYKPVLDYISIDSRFRQVEDKLRNNPRYAGTLISNVPTFFEKSDIYPGSTFVIGADTFERIAKPEDYAGGGDEVMLGIMKLRRNKNKFLVFPRIYERSYEPSPQHVNLLNELNKISTWVGDDYQTSDTASSTLRRRASLAE